MKMKNSPLGLNEQIIRRKIYFWIDFKTIFGYNQFKFIKN